MERLIFTFCVPVLVNEGDSFFFLHWSKLMNKVKLGDITTVDLHLQIAFHFGSDCTFWSFHKVSLQVLPVSSRPP